jgi:diadenylate cyclase
MPINWIRWQTTVDFFVLAVAIYAALQWARGTRALRVVLTILGIYGLARLAWHFELTITGWLLDIVSVLLVVMLLFFFQPELRHAFMRLDRMLGLGLRPLRPLESAHTAISQAMFAMASERIGALVVIGRGDSLRELVSGGTSLGAEISRELLEAIFRKESPIHDGAVLVDGDRISRAGVVLPLTQRDDVPSQFGTRHRAAMGIAERSDALVVVASEERGEVTLMHGLEVTHVRNANTLAGLLASLTSAPKRPAGARLRRWLFADLGYKLAALGIAAGIHLMSTFGAGSVIRTTNVPIEFNRVPAGMEVVSQSATRLEVQLRGTSWLLASVQMTGLVARFDLGKITGSAVALRVGPENLNLPPGVVLERVRPEVITVRLARGPD